jgi:hypothetical protein
MSGNPGCTHYSRRLKTNWNPTTSNPGPHTMSKYSPNHYQRGVIEVWDFIADQKLDYFIGNVVKYCCRAGYKSGEEEMDDLLKAKAYICKKIELLSKERNR